MAALARPAAAQGTAPVLLVVGDSVSAGYGLPGGKVWVAMLAAKLKERELPLRVVNASISGDTTAGGRARLPSLLAQHKPAVVVIELGGNDALRGGRLATSADNLDAMVGSRRPRARGAAGGHGVPAELRPRLRPGVQRDLRDVAKARKVPLVPFLFAGFAEDLALFQPDRIHPTRRRSRACWTTYGRRSSRCSSTEAAAAGPADARSASRPRRLS